MNFLENQDTKKRLLLQIEAYQNTPDFELANTLTKIPLFKLEHQKISLKDLESFNILKKLRLGNRVEYFFEYLINKQNRLKILEKSIQIVENKLTLGELDFLVFDQQNTQTIHVEIANKFYLYDDSINIKNERWVGPNKNDSLVQKCAKLKNKQFPLLQHTKTKEILASKGIKTENIIQQLNFKAQLFLPWQGNKTSQNKMYYLDINTFKTSIFESFQYFIPEKQDWFVDPKHGKIWFSFQEALESVYLHFEDKKSPLVWVKKPNNIYEKLFVVWW